MVATVPGTARADDAAIKQTVLNAMPRIWADFDQVNHATDGKVTRRKILRTIRLIRHTDADLARLVTAIGQQQASTPTGTAGQQDAVQCLTLTLQSNRAVILALRATLRGRDALAQHELSLAGSFYQASREPGNKADKELGLPRHTLGS